MRSCDHWPAPAPSVACRQRCSCRRPHVPKLPGRPPSGNRWVGVVRTDFDNRASRCRRVASGKDAVTSHREVWRTASRGGFEEFGASRQFGPSNAGNDPDVSSVTLEATR